MLLKTECLISCKRILDGCPIFTPKRGIRTPRSFQLPRPCGRFFPLMKLSAKDNSAEGRRSPETDGIVVSAETFDMIGRILKNLKGFNLESYKDKCIKRRIAIRIRATGCCTGEEYGEYLLRNEAELDRLLKVLTIHVSHFFRNPPTFDKLQGETIPSLFSRCRAEGRDSLRCWSVGCASGEEPYSLALLFKEHFTSEMEETSVAIVATDVDPATLDLARTGEYPEERLAEVPETLLRRWFVETQGKFRIAPEIREMVGFRQSDLADGDAFTASDLILCRNVLIYFERQQQEKILRRFAEVLHQGGILVLGKSETLMGESRRLFRTVCPVERIYEVV